MTLLLEICCLSCFVWLLAVGAEPRGRTGPRGRTRIEVDE